MAQVTETLSSIHYPMAARAFRRERRARGGPRKADVQRTLQEAAVEQGYFCGLFWFIVEKNRIKCAKKLLFHRKCGITWPTSQHKSKFSFEEV